jgi:hypothetical protein
LLGSRVEQFSVSTFGVGIEKVHLWGIRRGERHHDLEVRIVSDADITSSLESNIGRGFVHL